jgi:hypothetical protein
VTLGPEELGQQRIVEQLASRIAPQGLGIAVPRDVHDLGGRRVGHVGRGHEPPAQAVRGDVLDFAFGGAPACRNGRLTTSATTQPSMRTSRNSPCGENERNSGPFFFAGFVMG